MSEEEQAAPTNQVSFGEPVVLGRATASQADSGGSGGGGGCAPLIVVLVLVAVLAFLAMSPEGSKPPVRTQRPQKTATVPSSPIKVLGTPEPTPFEPTPTPTLATRRFPSDVVTFDCQPGIEVGKTVDVVHAAVRMRWTPGYVDKDDTRDSIHYMETGDKVLIRGGPEMKDGLCWWVVEHGGYRGWTADHSREGRLLLAVDQ